jgi:hypothetical protein
MIDPTRSARLTLTAEIMGWGGWGGYHADVGTRCKTYTNYRIVKNYKKLVKNSVVVYVEIVFGVDW